MTKEDFLKEIETSDPSARAAERPQKAAVESVVTSVSVSTNDEEETPAERRRREAALGITGRVGDSVDSEDEDDDDTRQAEIKHASENPYITGSEMSTFGFSAVDGLKRPAESQHAAASASSLDDPSPPRPKSCLKTRSPSPRISPSSAEGDMCENEAWEMKDIPVARKGDGAPRGKEKQWVLMSEETMQRYLLGLHRV